MNAAQLLTHFDRLAEAPGALPRLRRFILALAVRGKLVGQDARDESAEALLVKVKAGQARLVKGGHIKKSAPPDAVDADQQPFSIPINWAWCRLGDIGDWGSGSTPPRGSSEYYGNDITWLKSGELGDSLALSGSSERVTQLALEKCSFRLNQPGDVLIAMYGATIGKLAILAEEAVTNQAVCGCTPFTGVSNRYLFLFLHSRRADFHSQSEGGAQPNISKVKILTSVFALPPLAEQHRIVAKVDELMALCDQLEAAQQERERRRDRLAAASLQRLNQPAADTTPEAQREHARFHLKNLPRLTTRPEHIKAMRQIILNLAVLGSLSESKDWALHSQPLKTAATLQNGYAFKSEWFTKTGIRLLRNTNVSHGVIRWDELACLPVEQAEEFERFKLIEGDVVLSLDRPFIGTGTKVARVHATDLPCLLLQRVGRFQLNPNLLTPDYLFLWIESPQFTEQIDPGRSNGVPHISSKQVESAGIFFPPLAEQHRIVAKVDELIALCDQLEAQLATTKTDSRRLLEAVLDAALVPA